MGADGDTLEAVSSVRTWKELLLIAVMLVAAGAALGIARIHLVGGIVAALGCIPSCCAAWVAREKMTDGRPSSAMGMALLSAAVATVLLSSSAFGSVF